MSLACGISSYWDLPWVNGFLSCVFIALTVVVIVALFKIDNPVVIGLAGALIAASPATTETFFFLFTADGYMIAMLLAALAVYFSRLNENRKSRWLLSCICICISCGIYQAYVSFALVMAVCYFMNELFLNNYEKKEYCRWVMRQIIIYAVSLMAYYIIWKLCLHISGTVANDYQGISKVGIINMSLLISGLKNSVKSTLIYFLQWNVLEHGFTLYSVLNMIFIAVMAGGIIISALKSKIYKRKWAVVLLVLCIAAIVPFACIWHFTSEDVGYRPMMLQSLTLLFILTAILYERWTKPVAKNVVAVFLIIIVFNNTLMANISYFYMNLCYERTYAEGVEMMSEIHDLQDVYDFDKIAVVGVKASDVQLKLTDSITDLTSHAGSILLLSSLIETSLLYDSEHTTRFLDATFGFSLESLDIAQRNALLETDEVKAMGCWPSGNSITVIDDILVIKLSDNTQYY